MGGGGGGGKTFTNMSINNGTRYMPYMIPAAPNQGDKVICWYTGVPYLRITI